MAIKQTAGREALGEFAPKFAELNDDVPVIIFSPLFSHTKIFKDFIDDIFFECLSYNFTK